MLENATTTSQDLQQVPAWLLNLRQRRDYPYWLSLSAGVMLALGWYFPFTFVLFFALVPILELETWFRHRSGKAFHFFLFIILGFVIWNTGVYWWLWNATKLTPLVCVIHSVLQSIPLMMYHLINKRLQGKMWVMTFVTTWLGFEYLHLHWELSWIWLNLGNAFGNAIYIVQWFEYTGTLGGSMWVLFTNVFVFKTLVEKTSWTKPIATVALPTVFSLFLFFSYQEKGEPVNVTVVQPNIDTYSEKFETNVKTGEVNAGFVPYREQVMRHVYLADTAIAQADSVAFVLFPESSLPRRMNVDNPDGYLSYKLCWNFVTLHEQQGDDLVLITGANTSQLYDHKATPTAKYYEGHGYADGFNSALFINESGQPEFYHKSKLVVGPETVPFPGILNSLALNFGGEVGVVGRQAESEVFTDAEGRKAAPIICYESVYGGYVATYVQKGAQFLAIITNDDWWGDTPGHRQHFSYARLRAIETRRHVARAAYTGISGFINQRGEAYETMPYKTMGAKTATILLNDEQTFYVKYGGDGIGRVSAFIAVLSLAASFVKSKTERKIKKKPGKNT